MLEIELFTPRKTSICSEQIDPCFTDRAV